MDEETSGDPVQVGGDVDVYVDHGDESAPPQTLIKDELYTLYLYCEAKIDAIDAGLNWYGYTDEFVPAWSFDHLYGVARDLCNRALEAEQRVFSLLQMVRDGGGEGIPGHPAGIPVGCGGGRRRRAGLPAGRRQQRGPAAGRVQPAAGGGTGQEERLVVDGRRRDDLDGGGGRGRRRHGGERRHGWRRRSRGGPGRRRG